jgi:hypothetical protein
MAVLAPFLAWFAANDALAPFWDAVVRYNLAFGTLGTNADRQELAREGLAVLGGTGLLWLAAAGLAAGVVALAGRRLALAPAGRATLWIVTAALPLEVIFVALPGRPHHHYLMALVPVLTVLAGAALFGLVRLLEAHRPTGALLRAGAAGAVLVLLASQAASYRAHWLDSRRTRYGGVVGLIQSLSAPGEGMLVWGAEAGLNFLADRPAPTRYVYLYPLQMPGYSTAAMVEELAADLRARPPRLIVDAWGEGLSLASFGFTSPAIEAGDEFLRSRYALAGRDGRFDVYRLQP